MALMAWLDHAIRPALFAIGATRAKVLIIQAVNAAVSAEVVDSINYRDLVQLMTDTTGRVCYMQADVIKINEMAAEAQDVVLAELAKIDGQRITIPLGTVMGSVLFANAGPRLSVTIHPLGSATVEVEEDFRDVGINQVKHTLYITIAAEVRIVIPFAGEPVSVVTKAPVADVIIVGGVPSTYVEIGK
jgi:sporulation protein YunB